MKSLKNWLGLNLLPVLINLYLKTIRINIYNKPDNKENCIYIFWHSKMLIGWYLFRMNGYTALVSQSKDGEILSNILNRWSYKTVRGSSSKGGKEALSEIISILKQNNSAVITPDGPRGPAKEIKNGSLVISYECSIPIIPIKIINHKKKIFEKSWEKFELPLPFSKCDVHFGNKYFYKEYLDETELKKFKETLSKEM